MPGFPKKTDSIEKLAKDLKMKVGPGRPVGRPKKEEKRVATTLSLKPDFWQEMKEYAKKFSVKGKNISASETLMIIASLGLQALEKEPKAAEKISEILHRTLALNQPFAKAIEEVLESSKTTGKEEKK